MDFTLNFGRAEKTHGVRSPVRERVTAIVNGSRPNAKRTGCRNGRMVSKRRHKRPDHERIRGLGNFQRRRRTGLLRGLSAEGKRKRTRDSYGIISADKVDRPRLPIPTNRSILRIGVFLRIDKSFAYTK